MKRSPRSDSCSARASCETLFDRTPHLADAALGLIVTPSELKLAERLRDRPTLTVIGMGISFVAGPKNEKPPSK